MRKTNDDSFYEESIASRKGKKLNEYTLGLIADLHYRWMLDSEIGEELGLSALVIWHARTWHGINRHSNAPGAGI